MRNVNELKKDYLFKKDKELRVFNPDSQKFSVQYNGKAYTILSGEMRKFKYYVAKHIAKHLADKMLIKRNKKTDKEPERSEVLKKILI